MKRRKNLSYGINDGAFTATISECWYYTTNKNGEGLFIVTPWDRQQLIGTCDFSASSLENFKRKLTKFIRDTRSEFLD